MKRTCALHTLSRDKRQRKETGKPESHHISPLMLHAMARSTWPSRSWTATASSWPQRIGIDAPISHQAWVSFPFFPGNSKISQQKRQRAKLPTKTQHSSTEELEKAGAAAAQSDLQRLSSAHTHWSSACCQTSLRCTAQWFLGHTPGGPSQKS